MFAHLTQIMKVFLKKDEQSKNDGERSKPKARDQAPKHGKSPPVDE